MAARADERPEAADSFVRGRDLEFDRALLFTDAVYAIAMTLLVVGIAVPTVSGDSDSPSAMLDALGDKSSEFISFFVAFWIIGRYWLAHHSFVSRLRSADHRLISINLVYLGFVAFLPFPTALIGQYEENPISLVLFAGTLAVVSLLEVMLFRYAWRHGHTKLTIPAHVARWGMIGALLPVGIFLLSMPIAFLVDTTVALASWLLFIPFALLISHLSPPEVNEYLGRQ